MKNNINEQKLKSNGDLLLNYGMQKTEPKKTGSFMIGSTVVMIVGMNSLFESLSNTSISNNIKRDSLWIIAHLLTHKNNRVVLLPDLEYKMRIIEALITLIEIGDEEISLEALKTLNIITLYETLVWNKQIFNKLMNLIRKSTNIPIKVLLLKSLNNFIQGNYQSINDEERIYMEIIRELENNLLQRDSSLIIESLRFICFLGYQTEGGGHFDKFPKCINCLIQWSSDNNREIKKLGIGSIGNLGTNTNIKGIIAANGGLRLLKDTLAICLNDIGKEDNRDLLSYTLRAIGNICQEMNSISYVFVHKLHIHILLFKIISNSSLHHQPQLAKLQIEAFDIIFLLCKLTQNINMLHTNGIADIVSDIISKGNSKLFERACKFIELTVNSEIIGEKYENTKCGEYLCKELGIAEEMKIRRRILRALMKLGSVCNKDNFGVDIICKLHEVECKPKNAGIKKSINQVLKLITSGDRSKDKVINGNILNFEEIENIEGNNRFELECVVPDVINNNSRGNRRLSYEQHKTMLPIKEKRNSSLIPTTDILERGTLNIKPPNPKPPIPNTNYIPTSNLHHRGYNTPQIHLPSNSIIPTTTSSMVSRELKIKNGKRGGEMGREGLAPSKMEMHRDYVGIRGYVESREEGERGRERVISEGDIRELKLPQGREVPKNRNSQPFATYAGAGIGAGAGAGTTNISHIPNIPNISTISTGEGESIEFKRRKERDYSSDQQRERERIPRQTMSSFSGSGSKSSVIKNVRFAPDIQFHEKTSTLTNWTNNTTRNTLPMSKTMYSNSNTPPPARLPPLSVVNLTAYEGQENEIFEEHMNADFTLKDGKQSKRLRHSLGIVICEAKGISSKCRTMNELVVWYSETSAETETTNLLLQKAIGSAQTTMRLIAIIQLLSLRLNINAN